MNDTPNTTPELTTHFSSKFLSLHEVENPHTKTPYYFCSRKETPREHKPDAVVIYSEVTSEYGTGLLMVKEYRPATNDHVYSLPAGLIDAGETPEIAAERELLEETGHSLQVLSVSPTIYSSPGMTDESFVMVYGTSKKVSDNLEAGVERFYLYPAVAEHLMNSRGHKLCSRLYFALDRFLYRSQLKDMFDKQQIKVKL
jgi:8-oxo-dGTP pyrophosphatase MutT (NUDIX family)